MTLGTTPGTTQRTEAAPSDTVPSDVEQLRRRGFLLVLAGFAVCPCHLPFTLAAVGFVAGGTALGGWIVGHPLQIGVGLGLLTAVAYWRGFAMMRAAEDCASGALPAQPGTILRRAGAGGGRPRRSILTSRGTP